MPINIDPSWVSEKRFAEYLTAADGDQALATQLYEWNARASAALFELIHHVEVLLRNAIVRELSTRGSGPATPPGTPWVKGSAKIDEVEKRLRRLGKEPTEARIYAGLTFGFWQNMFGSAYDELWRHSLQHAFPHGRVDRKIMATYLESINALHNRIAHHGSLIERDTKVEGQKLLRLASWIDPAAARWLRSIETVSALSDQRPVTPRRNVVVVAGEKAWPLYNEKSQHAYVFQAARSIQLVEYVAFYADQEIKPTVARILGHLDAVDWNKKNAKRLGNSTDPLERELASIIPVSMQNGWNASVYQVFVLSKRDKDPETVTLPSPIKHSRRGKGSAFVQGHRYLSLTELRSADDTSDLGH